MDKNNNFDHIEDFLHGKLTREEVDRFHNKVENDPDFAEDYRMMMDLKEALKDRQKLEFLELVEKAGQNYDRRHRKGSYAISGRKISIRQLSFAAAAVALLALAVYILLSTRQKPNEQDLYVKYYAHFDHIIEFRLYNDTTGHFVKAMSLYKSGDFKDALNSFLASKDEFNNISAFYIGLCYLELDDYTKTINYLKKAVGSKSELQQDAQWYLALAYLANNDKKETIKLLELIIKTHKHDHQDQAEKLLEELR